MYNDDDTHDHSWSVELTQACPNNGSHRDTFSRRTWWLISSLQAFIHPTKSRTFSSAESRSTFHFTSFFTFSLSSSCRTKQWNTCWLWTALSIAITAPTFPPCGRTNALFTDTYPYNSDSVPLLVMLSCRAYERDVYYCRWYSAPQNDN